MDIEPKTDFWYTDEKGETHWIGPSGKQMVTLLVVGVVVFIVLEFILPNFFGITFS